MRMDLIDKMIGFRKSKDIGALVTETEISFGDLHVIVIKILSWLELEHKRSIWISEGRRNQLKPLVLDLRYPWCANLCKLVENEKIFQGYFTIRDGKFDFADHISEEERKIIRKRVFENYNPPRFT